MKLRARLDGKYHSLECTSDDAGMVLARVDDREFHLDQSQPAAGVFLLKADARVFEAAVLETAPNAFDVRLGTHELHVEISDPKQLRGSGTLSDHESGRIEIKTAMPGKVVRILHSVGAEVEKAAGIIIVEAMKMQNEMRSPRAGRVAEILVAEGDTVAAGDVLVVID